MPIGLPADSRTIRKYSTWFTIYGVVLLVLGVIAVIAPGLATLAVEIMVAWLLLIGGGVGVVAVVSGGTSAPGFWWNLLTSVLYVLAGGVLLWSPVAGAITLTMVLAAYLIAAGIAKAILAVRYRQRLHGAWGWMLMSALVDMVLGGLILVGLPFTGLWVLGLFVGIDLIFTGVALIMAAIAFRRMMPTETGERLA